MSTIIDGKTIAQDLRQDIKADIGKLGQKPGLAVILVGDNPASHVYVRNKIKACAEVGIESIEHQLPAKTQQAVLIDLIHSLNNDKKVHGILLQLPLPDQLDAQTAIEAIDPAKDVDGLHPVNIGRLVAGMEGLVPCTPQGSLLLIQSVTKELAGKEAVIVGRSLLFGKPMGQLLLSENCTVTQCHSKTQNLAQHCAAADILIMAVGKPEMAKADWVKPGATVIDVGINRIEQPATSSKVKLVGDVDFEAVKDVAGAITPVPGGVGPMTIACLLKNTLKAFKHQNAS